MKNSLSLNLFFRQMNSLVIYLVTAMFSRNFAKKAWVQNSEISTLCSVNSTMSNVKHSFRNWNSSWNRITMWFDFEWIPKLISRNLWNKLIEVLHCEMQCANYEKLTLLPIEKFFFWKQFSISQSSHEILQKYCALVDRNHSEFTAV